MRDDRRMTTRTALIATAIVLAAAAPAIACAQDSTTTAESPYAADHRSVGSIVSALYAVISGDAGEKRDWARLRAMFHPDARMIPTGRRSADRPAVARSITAEEYIAMSGPLLERDGFHEREISRRVERFGHIAHVFSSYDSRRARMDPAPFMRGINSIQLFNDGRRWWVMTVAWSQETPESPIPAEYLAQSQGRGE